MLLSKATYIQVIHVVVSMCVPWELNALPLSHRNIRQLDLTLN